MTFQTEQGEECYAQFLKDHTPEFILQESRSTDNREGGQTETENPERIGHTEGADDPAESSVKEEKREVADE